MYKLKQLQWSLCSENKVLSTGKQRHTTYLHRIQRDSIPSRERYAAIWEDLEHVCFHCPRFFGGGSELKTAFDTDGGLRVKTLILEIIGSEEVRDAVNKPEADRTKRRSRGRK